MPSSFRLANPEAAPLAMAQTSPFVVFTKPHDSHPSLDHLILLVFEAVMEVVCVSLPGYIIARLGHFDADKQKFLANLNVMLFTPCLSATPDNLCPRGMEGLFWLTWLNRSLHQTCFSAQR